MSDDDSDERAAAEPPDEGAPAAGDAEREPGPYAAVHARPDGESTVARQALTASEYGFAGLVVRNHGDAMADYDPERIAEHYGVDVVRGVEVRAADPSRASGFVGNHRSSATVVAVHGGDPDLNRFAVDRPAVDVLAHPMRGEGDFDQAMAKQAVENGVRVEFSFAPALRSTGGRRVRRLQSLRKLRELVEHYEVPYVVSADPHSHLEVRAPRELVALGEAVGFSPDQVRAGLAEWGVLARHNRHRRADAFVEPGVWRVDE